METSIECKDCGDECETFELENGICEECQEAEFLETQGTQKIEPVCCDFIFK